jgi:hypothetical protein
VPALYIGGSLFWKRRNPTEKPPRPGSEREETAGRGAPETTRPPFDPAEYARASDAKIRAATEVPPSDHPTVRPPEGFPQALTFPSEMRSVRGSIPDLQEVETSSGARDALGKDAVPFVMASSEDLGWFDLGSEAMRLLACVDGVSSLEAVSAKATMTAEEGAFHLLDLAERGVIGFR